MKHIHLLALAIIVAMTVIAAAPDQRQKGKGGGGRGATVEPAVVPEYPFNVWLCRPGADSITASILSWTNRDAIISFHSHPTGK